SSSASGNLKGVNAQIVWLDGEGVDPGEVGARAAALARLRLQGLSVPRAFALGRSLYAQLKATLRGGGAPPAHVPARPSRGLGRGRGGGGGGRWRGGRGRGGAGRR